MERFPPPLITNSNATASHKQSHVKSNVSDLNKSSIPELCNLTLDELQKLDQDPQYLNDFVDELGVVQRLHTDLDTLIEDIKVMATDNLSHEKHINELQAALELKLNEFRQLGGSYESLSARYQRKSDEFAPQHIKELLQIAASNADSACDTFVQQFLSGSIDVQNFLDQYKDAKRVSALRKAKEERLAHQLNELERAQF